jgi:hypothetical protein
MKDANPDRDKLLGYLQNIIERLATTSVAVKGWAITVTSAFLGFGIKDAKPTIVYVALVPIVCFWLLDAGLLAAERNFRNAFNNLLGDPSLEVKRLDHAGASFNTFTSAFSTPMLFCVYLLLAGCVVLVGAGIFRLG